uniref:Uncharacterized protein n=1 Tax=Arundo donax TaxID=35708 RepID=A0A0A9GBU2_ARUDO
MTVPSCQKDQQPDSGKLQHSLNLVLADVFHQCPCCILQPCSVCQFPRKD